MIQIEHVSKVYGSGESAVRALDDINVTIERGSFTCLIGGSGCGKSTLLNAIAGFDRPTAGKILIDGEEVTRPHASRQMIFQNYGLFPWRTVRGNVLFSMEHRTDLSRAERVKRADEALAVVGLKAYAKTYPANLSGGQRQRVAVARTLAAEPDVVFMDEPFGALDAITKMALQDEVRKIVADGKRTVIMVTHDIDEAIYLADRILVLKPNPGRIFRDVKVTQSFPRQRTGPDFLALRASLLESLDLASKQIEPEYTI